MFVAAFCLELLVGEPVSESGQPLQVPDFSRGDGLLPAIVQDVATGEVLMLAFMNAASFDETLATGRAVYFSRSRNRLWRKGEESGHVQLVREIFVRLRRRHDSAQGRAGGRGGVSRGIQKLLLPAGAARGVADRRRARFDPREVYRKP